MTAGSTDTEQRNERDRKNEPREHGTAHGASSGAEFARRPQPRRHENQDGSAGGSQLIAQWNSPQIGIPGTRDEFGRPGKLVTTNEGLISMHRTRASGG